MGLIRNIFFLKKTSKTLISKKWTNPDKKKGEDISNFACFKNVFKKFF
jgi:hypothetical protein